LSGLVVCALRIKNVDNLLKVTMLVKNRGKNASCGRRLWMFALFVVAALALIMALASPGPAYFRSGDSAVQTTSFAELLKSPPTELDRLGIARVNLACTEGLPGSGGMDTLACLRTLDEWAATVKAETGRHLYRFHKNPAEYDNSEAYFRMLMMAVVLYEDCGIRYNPERISAPAPDSDLSFFTDSRDLFLHGLCGPGRMGTCSSMPVLYVAIGRRLGYPLKLATTKAHVFLRWESETERFNLEATGRGMNKYDDEHYKRWPFPVSDAEIREDGFLRSLSPPEELALFLSLRAHCLRVAGRLPEAREALRNATVFAPRSRPYALLLSAITDSDPTLPPVAPFPALPPAAYGHSPPGPLTDPNPRLRIQ
jgi:hypothetical protein